MGTVTADDEVGHRPYGLGGGGRLNLDLVGEQLLDGLHIARVP
jgi:hypothetical protein